MEGYCVKCKAKREIKDLQAVFTSTGTPAVKGVCSVCGTKMFRMGRIPAHDGMTPPENVKKRKRKQPKRKGKLVIVESPAKARTIKRFLDKDFAVKASIGHVRDLLRSQLSVDVNDDFKPKYRVPNEKRQVVKEIKELANKAEEVYLATDPDREGEAIAWHLIEATDIDPKIAKRVVFHEITRPAIREAFTHPRTVNMRRVNAQQARRVLDRLVGYNLSPLLWRKVRGRLSAGRVQSVTLRLVIEREREIQAFVPEEYWTIEAEFKPDGKDESFFAKLTRIDGKEPLLGNQADSQRILDDMESAVYQVKNVTLGTRKRNPYPPFTTSTMQQDASRRLGFTARKTMRIAQQLYEGIDVSAKGATGLITYMRTDSTNVSKIAQEEARHYIQSRHGEKFIPPRIPVYKTTTRSAQEAHEAVRPTSVMRTPTSIKEKLTRDQFKLYQLIWRRFVASQMSAAVYSTIKLDVNGKSETHAYLLRSTGSKVIFPGFLAVYKVMENGKKNGKKEERPVPTDLVVGQGLELIKLIPEQHFTQPPPRYSDATLVKAMEEYGIGRPSTYAPILSTLQQRGYIERDGRRLVPTEIGFIVNDLLVEHFPNVLDINFTASMEEDLDKVASGKREWVDVVREFYEPFSKQVDRAKAEMPEVKAEPEKVGRKCPECGHDLIIRWGRHGKFIGCSNFPTCRYTEPFLKKIGVPCPECKDGEIVERRTRKGRIFYGCSNYPACEFTSWKRPIKEHCPKCGGVLVMVNKNHVQCLSCNERFTLDEIITKPISEMA